MGYFKVNCLLYQKIDYIREFEEIYWILSFIRDFNKYIELLIFILKINFISKIWLYKRILINTLKMTYIYEKLIL